MDVECPQCGSKEMHETGKFDLTVIEKTECRHDFECDHCGCLFSIVYAPIEAVLVERGDALHCEDGAVLDGAGEILGEFDDGRFVPSLFLLEADPSYQDEVDRYAATCNH